MEGSTPLELVGAPARLAYPSVCANCGTRARSTLRIGRRFEVRGRGRKLRLFAARVPFCDACVRTHRAELPRLTLGQCLGALFKAGALVPAVGFAAGAGFAGRRLVAIQPHLGVLWSSPLSAPDALPWAAATVACALLALVCVRRAVRAMRLWTLRDSPVSEAFWFGPDISQRFERQRHTYTLRNPRFAAEFETCNRDRRWDPTSRSTRWTAELRNIVLGIFALAAAAWWLMTIAEH